MIEFIFITTREGESGVWPSTARSISRQDAVAQVRRGHQHLAVARRPREAGEVVEEVGHVLGEVLPAGEEPEVGVEARGGGVVVARPDVDVAAHPVALPAHDQGHLGVRLQARQAVDHVDPGALQRPRPLDVALLVEAGLQLHQADGLLALLGGAHQGRDDRRVAAGAVHGLLDRQHVGVLDGLLHEALDARVEVVVGVMDQQVSGADDREQVAALALLGLEAGLGAGLPGGVAQQWQVEEGEVPERGHVERPRDAVRIEGAHLERLLELRDEVVGGALLHLEAHDVPEAPAAELGLDRPDEVVGLVGDREVGVARDPEPDALGDLHPREETVNVTADHLYRL